MKRAYGPLWSRFAKCSGRPRNGLIHVFSYLSTARPAESSAFSLLRKMVCYANIVVMTTESANTNDDPRQLLSNSQKLMVRVRQTQRATWLPLLVMSAITFLAIPVLRYSHRTLATCGVPTGGGYACHVYSSWGVWYWPVALVLAYLGISYFYIRRSQAQGLESRILTFTFAGIGIAIVVTAMGYWAVHLPVGDVNFFGLHIQERSLGLLHRLATPACAIGLALLVLARIERNRPLVIVNIVYLAFVLLPIDFGWNLNQSRNWNFLPRLVIYGGVLLLSGIGFALAQRPKRLPIA